MKPVTYIVTKASNDGTFQVGDRIEQMHDGQTWIQNRHIFIDPEASVTGSVGMKFISEREFHEALDKEITKSGRKDYSYGSQGHIDLAVEAMKVLLDHFCEAGAMSSQDRCDAIAAEAFCMAEAMMRQIESL